MEEGGTFASWGEFLAPLNSVPPPTTVRGKPPGIGSDWYSLSKRGKHRTHCGEARVAPPLLDAPSSHWPARGIGEMIGPSLAHFINLNPSQGQQPHPLPLTVVTKLCFADTVHLTYQLFWGSRRNFFFPLRPNWHMPGGFFSPSSQHPRDTVRLNRNGI